RRLEDLVEMKADSDRSKGVSSTMPAYLDVAPEQLGQGTPVKVRVGGDVDALANEMAEAMLAELRNPRATLIIPVGPVGQFPIFADLINRQRVDCRDICLINMDEYLTDDNRWIDIDHPLSFRGFM